MKIMFIFDRVFHYHKALFVYLEKELKKEGHTLILLTGKTSENEKGRTGLKSKVIDKEYKYTFSEYHVKSFVFRRQNKIDKIITRLKPDVMVTPSHVGNITTWTLQNKKTYNHKIVSWQCGYEYNKNIIKDVILRKFLNNFDYHLAYHTNAKKYVLKYDVPSERVKVIHNTINESEIRLIDRNEAKNQIVNSYPNLRKCKIALFVGAILKEKLVELIIEAIKQINRDDLGLIIVGDGPHLEHLKAECGDMKNIVFTGRIVDNVGVFFDAADIFVLPGTGGLALNEAMAHSLPIISGYADGSADDLVIPNLNGFRLYNFTVKELSGYLVKIIDNDKLREKMGKESRKMITNELSFATFIKKVSDKLIEIGSNI